ncbi:MAG: SnoaL-like polyketide cyclase [Chitinophagaceae bacterium]|jgi:ketosteroid isomerase-like protein|nr:SnoaL-like polyketide cyclase [Chitinophagaceae bacterium]
MKKVLFVAALAVAMVSCDTKVSNEASTDHKAVADKNAEGTKKVFAALQSGDVAGLDSLFTEDVIDHDAGPNGQDIKGRDSVKAAIAKMHTYFEGLKIEIAEHATSSDGTYHFALAKMTGKATAANPWGMPAGMSVDDTNVEVVKMKDGKCSEHWSFMSMHDMHEAMAATKGGGAPPVGEKKN